MRKIPLLYNITTPARYCDTFCIIYYAVSIHTVIDHKTRETSDFLSKIVCLIQRYEIVAFICFILVLCIIESLRRECRPASQRPFRHAKLKL